MNSDISNLKEPKVSPCGHIFLLRLKEFTHIGNIQLGRHFGFRVFVDHQNIFSFSKLCDQNVEFLGLQTHLFYIIGVFPKLMQ